MAKTAKPKTEKRVLTQEDLDLNPELVEQGLKVGDEVELPTPAKKTKQAEFAVYNASGAYVRTYSLEAHGEEAEELAEEYAKKIGGTVR